jgi:hypothetical protein
MFIDNYKGSVENIPWSYVLEGVVHSRLRSFLSMPDSAMPNQSWHVVGVGKAEVTEAPDLRPLRHVAVEVLRMIAELKQARF